MTTDQVVKIISSMPEARKIGDDSYWKTVIPYMLQPILDEISVSYDFAFVLDEYSDVTTVADRSEYTMSGRNHTLRDIISIRYGSGYRVLDKLRTLDADDLKSSGSTFGDVAAWCSFKLSDSGFPIVTLFDTPATSGEVLYVRYRMKDVSIDRFPASFGWVIAHGVLSWVQVDFRPEFIGSLKKMIQRYRTGGKDISLATMDPSITTGNRLRASLNGIG